MPVSPRSGRRFACAAAPCAAKSATQSKSQAEKRPGDTPKASEKGYPIYSRVGGLSRQSAPSVARFQHLPDERQGQGTLACQGLPVDGLEEDGEGGHVAGYPGEEVG